MVLGNRKPRSSAARRGAAYRPTSEALEARIALAGNSIDLANIATTPFGVELAGFQPGGNAGQQVAYLGDTNRDAYDDFVVTAANNTSTQSQVLLVLGSNDVTNGIVPWNNATLTPQGRVGALGTLGNPNQVNPINGLPGYNYNGVSFGIINNIATAASVAAVGDVNNDGNADFMIGFPNADGGAGRAYLVYGSPTLTALGRATPFVNLDSPPQGLTVVTFRYQFPTSFTTARAGAGLAAIGNALGDTRTAIAIGAPGATYTNQQQGAVYVVPNSVFNTTANTTVFLDGVGQTGGTTGFLYVGANVGDRAGRSIAGLGNFGKHSATTGPLSDFVIGAPGFDDLNNNTISGQGFAYLIYGATNMATFTQTVTVGATTVRLIPLSRVGSPAITGNLAGAIFQGASDATGFAVSSAGDFNNDTFSDLLIGSPGFNNFSGEATLIYGQAFTPTAPGPIVGVIPLATIPSTIGFAQFVGAGPGSQAGWSLSQVGRMRTAPFNEIIIGSPGFLNNAGTAYLIPGQASLLGVQQLAQAQADPIDATQIINSTASPFGGLAANRLGASVSGRLTTTTQLHTLDFDLLGDFVIGAPGFALNTTRTTAGAVFAGLGTFIPLATPINAQIVTTIGVDTPFPPFNINPTTPATLQVFVFSSRAVTPPFRPVTDINPTTVVINGIAFPNATITPDPVDENGDGIPDAIITVTRATLGLIAGSQTFAITGRTLATSPNANKTWGGTTTITVTGGGGGGGGGGPAGPTVSNFFNLNFPGANAAVPVNGERLVPTVATLSHLTWKPLPVDVALKQFRPSRGFALRQASVFNPDIKLRQGLSKYLDAGHGIETLGRHVFDRSVFHAGEPFRFVHPVPVIPRYLQAVGSVTRPRRKG